MVVFGEDAVENGLKSSEHWHPVEINKMSCKKSSMLAKTHVFELAEISIMAAVETARTNFF